MRFLREYKPGRYSSTWANLVYEEADGPYKFNVYFDKTGITLINNVAGTALLVPGHVIEWVEQMVDDGIIASYEEWRPCDPPNVYSAFPPQPDPINPQPPPEYPFMTQLVGSGPFVFHHYDRSLAQGQVTKFEDYFVDSPVEGSVHGEWRINPGDDYTYQVVAHNIAAKEWSDEGECANVTVDVAIYEDGAVVHIVNDTYLTTWNWTYLGPYTKTGVSCGPHTITVNITGDAFTDTYTHQYVATIREDVNTYTGEQLDFTVDMRDVGRAARAFGSYPGHLRWDPACDINDDFIVDMRDIGSIARKFGWHC
jgi:hypothetical protein